MRRLPPICVAACAVALLAPVQAQAHAVLESSSPRAGAVVAEPPDRVVLAFSEPVEGNFGALRVFDSAGRRVDQGGAFHPAGDSKRLAIRLEADAPVGSTTVVWRVVSADSHVVSGGLVFSIGRASSPQRTVSELAADSGPSATVDGAMGLARGFQFLAIGIALGAVLFLMLTWAKVLALRPAGAAGADRSIRRRSARLVAAAAVVGAAASLLGLVAQGALAGDTGLADGATPSVLAETVGTRFGSVWALALLAWLATAGLSTLLSRGGRWSAAIAIPLAFLAAVPALSGHATTHSPAGVLAAANIVHVCAVSAWVGGVVSMLAAAIPSFRRAGAAGGRLALATLERFSAVALVAVGTIIASGVIQSVLVVGSPSMLVETPYGRAILVKVALLAGLVGIGAAMRVAVVPRLRRTAAQGGAAAIRLAVRLFAVETALFVAVLAATAALASYPPIPVESSGPVARTVQAGPIELQMTLDPARPGVNAVHLYLADPRTGTQDDSAREVSVEAAPAGDPAAKVAQRARKAGPGHWIASQLPLTAAGDWRITVTARVSEFDQHTAEATFAVR